MRDAYLPNKQPYVVSSVILLNRRPWRDIRLLPCQPNTDIPCRRLKNGVEFLITGISRLAVATFNQRQAEDSTPEAAASSHHELSVFERKAPRSI
jgi:hypothetical protein